MTENKKSRMYEADGKTVRTWNVFKGCNFDCVYCVQREQAKRQKHRCELCYQYKPHMHPGRLGENFKAGETVFVAAAGDISFASFDQFADILDVIGNYPNTTFYIQSKNPAYFVDYYAGCDDFIGWNPDVGDTNVVLGTTIESSRSHCFYPKTSHSTPPYQISRAVALQNLNHPRKSVTVEPIFDFDAVVLIAWLKAIAPEFVYVGYLNPLWKAKKLQLPEPPLEKTKELCWELSEFTEVRLKTIRKGWDEE